jgi:outer membrane receptor protein involved in Fe transport
LAPHQRIAAEIGLRWDEQSYPADSQVSPRVGALLDLGDRTTLRVSWGRFHQAQGINELQVNDGFLQLFPAQEAEHTVLSLEYDLSDWLLLRAEVYRKEFERVRPRFENLLSRVSLVPELLPDRVIVAPLRGEARGLELSLEAERARWQWWVNFTRAAAEDRLQNRWVRRSWEEPWSAKGGAIWLGEQWTVSGTLTLRSGWPLTRLALVESELVAGPYNADAFETFRSLDLRATRRFELGRGRLEAFVELTNALNFDNPCCLEYEVDVGPGALVRGLALETDDWLPVVPSFGVLWQF